MTDRAGIAVRVVVLGRSVRRVVCPAGSTLARLLELSGVETAGRDVNVNGRPAEPSSTLADGDLVTVIPRVRGGSGPVSL